MSALSDATVNALLGARFGGRALPAIATYYVCLSSTQPALDGTGVTEPAASEGYAAVALGNDTASWAVPANRTVATLIDVLFPQAKKASDGGVGWGAVGFYVVRAGTANGALVGWGSIPLHVVQAGEIVRLPAGTVKITSPVS